MMKSINWFKYILWIIIGLVAILSIDIIRCKVSWCPYRFWRMNSFQKCSDTCADTEFNCIDSRCMPKCTTLSDCPNKDYFSCVEGSCLLSCDSQKDCLDSTPCDSTGVCMTPAPDTEALSFAHFSNTRLIKLRGASYQPKNVETKVEKPITGYSMQYYSLQ